jgi:hypothetical protein
MSKFLEGIAALFNKPQTELSQLYTGENNDTLDEEKALAAIKEWMTAKVKDVQKNQHARGIKETAEAWESALAKIAQDRKIQLPEDVKGVEALNAFVETLTSVDPKAKDGELSIEDIRKLRNFQLAVEDTIKPIKTKLTEAEKALNEERQVNTVKFNREKVIQAALQTLEDSKWKAGETPEEKELRRATILERLEFRTGGFKRVKVEGDTITLLDENGNPLKDDLQDTVDFKKWVSGLNPFGVHVFDKSKGSAGASNNGKPNDGGEYVVQSGVSLEEALNGVTDGGERAKITYAYAKSLEPQS